MVVKAVLELGVLAIGTRARSKDKEGREEEERGKRVRGTRKVLALFPVASSLSLGGGERSRRRDGRDGRGRVWHGQGSAGQRQLRHAMRRAAARA